METSYEPGTVALSALNTAMMDVYEKASVIFQEHLLDRVPVILALFSGEGGRMLLFTPGREMLEAPGVPASYQYLKSVGHSPVGIYEIVASALLSRDFIWQKPMADYADVCRVALGSIEDLQLSETCVKLLKHILKYNLQFVSRCLSQGIVDQTGLQQYGRVIAPALAQTVDIAADIQVRHWMQVLDGWQRKLGANWPHTYAASNTLYVTRRNNILFSVLAQFMGEDAIGDRLLLFETPQFTTTPDLMLSALTRILSDRELGESFFGCHYLTDSEVLGGAAREAIVREAERRGMRTALPSLAPLKTHEWPWQTEPGARNCPRTLADVVEQLPGEEEKV